jgi:hypothetical protein
VRLGRGKEKGKEEDRGGEGLRFSVAVEDCRRRRYEEDEEEASELKLQASSSLIISLPQPACQ